MDTPTWIRRDQILNGIAIGFFILAVLVLVYLYYLGH